MQAQCLYQPGEFPLAGADPRERYVETTIRFMDSHFRFLLTAEAQRDPPFRRTRCSYEMAGLGLDEAAANAILWRNAVRLIRA